MIAIITEEAAVDDDQKHQNKEHLTVVVFHIRIYFCDFFKFRSSSYFFRIRKYRKFEQINSNPKLL